VCTVTYLSDYYYWYGQGDLQQYVINLLKSEYTPSVQSESMDNQQRVSLYACLICMCMNVICVVAYRIDMHELLKEAKVGHKESLFMAINIDVTVASTETASMLIAQAALENDNTFFDRLSRAINGGYSRRLSGKYAKLIFLCIWQKMQ